MKRSLFGLAALVGALCNQAGAQSLHLDYTHGQLPSSLVQVTTLTPSTTLTFANNNLQFTDSLPGDGINLFVPNYDAECIAFEGLSLDGFQIGEGVDFEIGQGKLSDNGSVHVELFQSNSIRVKIVEDKHPGTKVIFTDDISNFALSNLGELHVDWVPLGSGDSVDIAIYDKQRKLVLSKRVPSALKHSPGFVGGFLGLSYNISGLELRQDPIISLTGTTLTPLRTPEPSFLGLALGFGSIFALHFRNRHKRRTVQ